MITIWCARAIWGSLPVLNGGAIGDALRQWSSAPAHVATALLWTAWTAGMLALLAPRTWGFTMLRVVAPAAVICTLAAAPDTSTSSAVVSITASIVGAVLACSAPVAHAAANSLAYGDETRFPLRVPIPLAVSAVPVAVAVVIVGLTSGPLLLADESVALGAAAVLIGLPLAAFAARSLHILAARWLVLVPAGVVVVDPLTLTDATLVRREQIATLGHASRRVPAGTIDLTLGSLLPPVLLDTRTPITLSRRHGRRNAQQVTADSILVAPVLSTRLLTAAQAHRIPVG